MTKKIYGCKNNYLIKRFQLPFFALEFQNIDQWNIFDSDAYKRLIKITWR